MTLLRAVRRLGSWQGVPATLPAPGAAALAAAASPVVTADTEVGDLPDNGWELTAAMVGLEGVGVNPNNLASYSGGSTISTTTTIEDRKITGDLTLNGSGTVTLRRCWLTGRIIADHSTTFGGTLIVEDCLWDTGLRGEAGGLNGYAYYEAITTAYNNDGGEANVARSVIRGFGRGAWVDVPGLWEHVVYEQGIWWGNPATDGSHNEAITHRNTAHPVFEACRFDHGPYSGATNGQQNLSGVVQIQGDGSSAGNITLDRCYLNLATNLLGQPHVVADWHSPGSIVDGSINVIDCRFSPGSSAYQVGSSDKGTWTGNHRYDPDNPPTYAGSAVT